jgi:hypothetical protein
MVKRVDQLVAAGHAGGAMVGEEAPTAGPSAA